MSFRLRIDAVLLDKARPRLVNELFCAALRDGKVKISIAILKNRFLLNKMDKGNEMLQAIASTIAERRLIMDFYVKSNKGKVMKEIRKFYLNKYAKVFFMWPNDKLKEFKLTQEICRNYFLGNGRKNLRR